MIDIKNLSFSYDDEHVILNDINMHVPSGKIIAIMGGSGCGKTTLLKLISGQLKHEHGVLNVFDQDMRNISSDKLANIRKKMGVLFQFGALFTDLNVYENVACALIEHSKLPAEIIEIIVAMKLEVVGLNGTQQLAISQLSGGMARRVALARAMAMDPQLMMYDEPFTGLDPISLNTIATLIKTTSQQLGQTAIIVSHDIQATFAIADYIYFMAQGKILAHGTAKEMQSSDNPAVQQFITGAIDGPFAYQYPSKRSYYEYLGI